MSPGSEARRAPSESAVAEMFDRSVGTYDLLNDILSMGFDRLWWRRASSAVQAAPGARVLDLGCGTGSLSKRLAERYRVVGVDVSRAMLGAARERLGGRVRLVRGSAFRLPFADRSFEGAASAFVLRNLEDLPGALTELARVIRPGGTVAITDITEPDGPVVRRLFDAYFGVAAPALGRLAGNRDAYAYLARSLGQLPPPPEVSKLLTRAGFERVVASSLPPGAVTLWRGVRSRDG